MHIPPWHSGTILMSIKWQICFIYSPVFKNRNCGWPHLLLVVDVLGNTFILMYWFKYQQCCSVCNVNGPQLFYIYKITMPSWSFIWIKYMLQSKVAVMLWSVVAFSANMISLSKWTCWFGALNYASIRCVLGDGSYWSSSIVSERSQEGHSFCLSDMLNINKASCFLLYVKCYFVVQFMTGWQIINSSCQGVFY